MTDAVLNERLALAEHSGALREFCERWRVIELAVFGSVLRDDFTDVSDVDVLIKLDSSVKATLLMYLDMQDELTQILGRRADIVFKESIERDPNYLRRRAILGSALVIYAA